VIGDRAFSDQIDIVIDCARAFIYGMHEAGMASVGKHFPGHGSIIEDSHLEKPLDNRPLVDIQNKDLIPFKELINNLDGIMTAHILFSEIDKDIPTFSKKWISGILKEEMEFKGMVFSDDLSMKGTMDYESFYEKTKQAIVSGCEMILICNNRKGVLDGIRYFEENQIQPSEKVFSMLMASDVSWINLEKDKRRIAISEKLKKLI
jgi:beta-N-acetylhexosaminidase